MTICRHVDLSHHLNEPFQTVENEFHISSRSVICANRHAQTLVWISIAKRPRFVSVSANINFTMSRMQMSTFFNLFRRRRSENHQYSVIALGKWHSLESCWFYFFLSRTMKTQLKFGPFFIQVLTHSAMRKMRFWCETYSVKWPDNKCHHFAPSFDEVLKGVKLPS